MNMSDVAIRVDNLGKRYRLGRRERYSTLRDTLAEAAQTPWRWLTAKANGNGRSAAADTLWALRDLSFEVTHGEVVGIIGRNGAGKSTLLKILSQITEPTTGQVELSGRVASLLEVGTGFHPELTGRENIFLNGAILGMKRAEIIRKFDEIIAFAEVDKFLDTPVKHYSSGMQMRLAFAVAAHLEPEILIVDEVLAVGDAEFQRKCLGKMGEVARDGRTVLFVSHNMQAIRGLCSRVCVLRQGNLAFDGPSEEGLLSYVNTGHDASNHWQRKNMAAQGPLYFTSVTVAVCGRQPQLRLEVDLVLRETGPHCPSFVSIDIRDEIGSPIMQALPSIRPFTQPGRGEHVVRMIVELPPLIPGTYTLSPWVGPHNTVTYDWAEGIVAFTVENSPDPTRTFPHARDHGHVVPPSRVEYSST
jgi:lipopolysaccharide transport system ATP-binding protein